MVKSKNGGNREGFGFYEMLKLALTHPVYFSLIYCMLKFHMNTLARKILGIN